MELDFAIRQIWERYAQMGTRPYEYNLTRLAGGEYVSSHTENDWRRFRDGYKLGQRGENCPTTRDMLVPRSAKLTSLPSKSSRVTKKQ